MARRDNPDHNSSRPSEKVCPGRSTTPAGWWLGLRTFRSLYGIASEAKSRIGTRPMKAPQESLRPSLNPYTVDQVPEAVLR